MSASPKTRLQKIGPPIVSGVLSSLAFPPFSLALLVFVSLVPWITYLRETDGRGAWRSGYLYGMVFGMGQMYWVGALAYRWTGSPPLGILPWILSILLYAIYFGLIGVLIRKCWSRGWPWLIPIAWAGVEVFRSFIPTFAFPWGLLATPLVSFTPIAQSAHYGLIFLVSAWVVSANMLVILLLGARDEKTIRQAKPIAAGFVLVLALSLYRYAQPEVGKPYVVTSIQPGVDLAFGDLNKQSTELRRYIQPVIDRAESDGTDLIVMPEGIAKAPNMPPFMPFNYGKIPVLFGAHRGTEPSYQSAIGFDGTYKWSDKTRLVIFGEYVPLRQYLTFLASAFKLPGSDMKPGIDGVKSMNLKGTEIGPVVCFEAVFPEVPYLQARNGAQLLGVISVDDWYMGTGAPEQLRALTIWRSIETGLPLVRSATQGYTLVTDGHGRILAEAPLKEHRSLRQQITLPPKSPMSPLSALFPALSFLVATFLLILPGRVRTKVVAEPEVVEAG